MVPIIRLVAGYQLTVIGHPDRSQNTWKYPMNSSAPLLGDMA